MKRCDNCKHWSHEGDNWGHCRHLQTKTYANDNCNFHKDMFK